MCVLFVRHMSAWCEFLATTHAARSIATIIYLQTTSTVQQLEANQEFPDSLD